MLQSPNYNSKNPLKDLGFLFQNKIDFIKNEIGH